jgi:hypothetical protein
MSGDQISRCRRWARRRRSRVNIALVAAILARHPTRLLRRATRLAFCQRVRPVHVPCRLLRLRLRSLPRAASATASACVSAAALAAAPSRNASVSRASRWCRSCTMATVARCSSSSVSWAAAYAAVSFASCMNHAKA